MPQMTVHEAIALAIRHQSAGNLLEAEALYRRVLSVDPDQPDALHLLGVIAFQCGKLDLAGELIRRAIQLRPDHADSHNNLGLVMAQKGQVSASILEYRKAMELDPRSAEIYSNLSDVLREDGQFEQAIAVAKKAYSLQPKTLAGNNNVGSALLKVGCFEEAIQSYRQAVEVDPNSAIAHYNLATALLTTGHLEEGWQHAEWRWQVKDLGLVAQHFPQPQWDGSPLNGRVILLHAEQGFGDVIHFARYIPEVLAQGGRVILAVQRELVRLMKSIRGVDAVVTDGERIPAFDVHCPMLTLPLLLKTTLETIPAPIPYLEAEQDRIEHWRERVHSSNDPGLKVGLVWAGRPEHRNDRNRSIPLELFAPLERVTSVRLFSLQKGRAATQAENPPGRMVLVRLGEDIEDFADCAGLLENLDLLITADTAPAHLAGALGKPVWMLVPFVPDWRWLLERSDSPWYPTFKLFRQPRPGDWQTPLERLVDELQIASERRSVI